jgi:hypothetical protein
MNSYFLVTIILIFVASVTAVFLRVEERKRESNIIEGNLSADDFEIIE